MKDGIELPEESVSEGDSELMEIGSAEEDVAQDENESVSSRKRKRTEELEEEQPQFDFTEDGCLQMPIGVDRSNLSFTAEELPEKLEKNDEEWPAILDLLILPAVRVSPIGFQYFLSQCTKGHYEKFVKKLQPNFGLLRSEESPLSILFVIYEVWKTLTLEERKEWDTFASETIFPEGVPENVKTFGDPVTSKWVRSLSTTELPCILCSPEAEERYEYNELLAHIMYSHSFVQIYACQHCGQAYQREEHLHSESHCRAFRQSSSERKPFLTAVCTLVCIECGFQYVMSSTANKNKCSNEYLSVVLSHPHGEFAVVRTLSHEKIGVDKVNLSFMSRNCLMPGSCDQCEHHFSTIVEGRKHFEKKHPLDVEKFRCAKCPYSTCNKQSLRDHITGSHLTKWSMQEVKKSLAIHPPSHCAEAAITSSYTAQLSEDSEKINTSSENTSVRIYTGMRLSNAVIEATPIGSNRFDTLTLSAKKEYRQELQINVSIENPFNDTTSGAILNENVYYCYSCSTIFLGKSRLEQHQAACDAKRQTRDPLNKEGSILLLARRLFSADRTLRCPLCPRVRCCSVSSLRRHLVNTHDQFAFFQATNLTLEKYVKSWIADQASGLMYEFSSKLQDHLEAIGVAFCSSDEEEPPSKHKRSDRIRVLQMYMSDNAEQNLGMEIFPSRLIAYDGISHYCHICKEAYGSSNVLRDHLKRRHAYLCADCGGAFMTEAFYESHQCAQIVKDILSITCGICDVKTHSIEAFYNHIADAHFSNINFCSFTGQIFPRLVESCIEKDIPNRICSLCALPDFRVRELTAHMERHAERWDRCPLCKILSPDKPHLKEPMDHSTNSLFLHIYVEHCPLKGGGVRACYFCSRSIPQPGRQIRVRDVSQLIRHLIFECDPCNYCLLCNDGQILDEPIRDHRIRKHSDIFHRFRCPVCRMRFRTYAAYRVHKIYDQCSEEIANGNGVVEDENFVVAGKTRLASSSQAKPNQFAVEEVGEVGNEPPLATDSENDDDDDDILIDEEVSNECGVEHSIEHEVRATVDSLLDAICGPLEDIQVVKVCSSDTPLEEDAIEVIDDELAVVGEGKGLTTQRKEPMFQCSKCSAKFQKQYNLDIHMKEHVNDCGETIDEVFGVPRNRSVFVCRSCCLAYEDQQVYGRHRERHGHVFSCSQCNAINSHRNIIQEHYDQHCERASKRLVFGCSMCSIGFHSNEGFCHHMSTEHDYDLLFFCKNCGFGHTSADKCVEHIFAQKCMHNDTVASVLGVCMASIFHYQPQNIEEHRTSVSQYPDTAVTPSDCTHRSFFATNECMVSCRECAVLVPYSTYYHMGHAKDAQTLRICPNDNTSPLFYTKTYFVKQTKLKDRLAYDESGSAPPRTVPPVPRRPGITPLSGASRANTGIRVLTPSSTTPLINRRIGQTNVVVTRPSGALRTNGTAPVIIRHNPHAVVAQQRSTSQARSLYNINNARQVPVRPNPAVRYHIGSAPSSSGLSSESPRNPPLMTVRLHSGRNPPFEAISRSVVSENDKTPVQFPADRSGLLRCGYSGCDATFSSRAHGFVHRIRHIKHKYVCLECGRAQISEKDAVIHQFTQHVKRFTNNDIEYRLTCPCCYRVFLTLALFSQHLSEAAHDGLRCMEESCFRRFGTQSLARHHTLVHQLFKRGKGTYERPQCCPLCATIEKYWEHQFTDGFTINHSHVHGFVQKGLCRCCGWQSSANDISFQGHFRSQHCKKIADLDAFICQCGEQVPQKEMTAHVNENHFVQGLRFNPGPGKGKLLVETTDSFMASFGIGQSGSH